MLVKVAGKTEELFIYKENCAVDYATVFVDPYECPDFNRDTDGDMWYCDQDTYDWWLEMCTIEQAIVNAIDSDDFNALPNTAKSEFYSLEFESNDFALSERRRYEWLDEKGLIEHE